MKEYNAREIIKRFLKERNVTLVHAVELMNANHPDETTTSQNLTNKLMRNTIKFSEVMEIADVLGCEICFQEIGAESTAPDLTKTEEIELPDLPIVTDGLPEKETQTKEEQAIAILDRVNTPFTVIKGIYFPEILIIGENCKLAAMNLNLSISTNTKKGKSQKGMISEVLQCAYFEGAFDVIIYPCGYEEYDKEIK